MLREHRTSGVGLRFNREAVRVRTVSSMPHGWICTGPHNQPIRHVPAAIDRALSGSFERVSECLVTQERLWIGKSTYLAVGGQDARGVPTAELAAVDEAGSVLWHRTFPDNERVEFAPDGRTLAVVGASRLQVLDTKSGRIVTQVTRVQDAQYVGANEFVVVNKAGDVDWRSR